MPVDEQIWVERSLFSLQCLFIPTKSAFCIRPRSNALRWRRHTEQKRQCVSYTLQAPVKRPGHSHEWRPYANGWVRADCRTSTVISFPMKWSSLCRKDMKLFNLWITHTSITYIYKVATLLHAHFFRKKKDFVEHYLKCIDTTKIPGHNNNNIFKRTLQNKYLPTGFSTSFQIIKSLRVSVPNFSVIHNHKLQKCTGGEIMRCTLESTLKSSVNQ